MYEKQYLKVPEMWAHKVCKTPNLNGHYLPHNFPSQSKISTQPCYLGYVCILNFGWEMIKKN